MCIFSVSFSIKFNQVKLLFCISQRAVVSIEKLSSINNKLVGENSWTMDQVHHELSDNPRENANILSVLTFFWTIKLFKRGYRKVLDVGDLFKPLKADKSENLGERLEK